ncbi:MAG: hypothetical protein AAB268_06890 [Elusimicrobiota bacterium]
MQIAKLCAIVSFLFTVAASAQTAGSWSALEGQQSRILEHRTVAVTNQAAWEEMWKEHAPSASVPEMNFDEGSVVAVFLGTTKAAGVKIKIAVQDDTINPDRIHVFYHEEVRPASNSFAAQVICHPFSMVKVRKIKEVSFEVNARVSIPEKLPPPKSVRDDSKVRKLLEARLPFTGC